MSELIRDAGGRQTQPRIRVLQVLLQAKRTISHADLHRRLSDIDRVSLYRILDWLVEHRLAHQATNGHGIQQYGPSHPSDGHLHPHFHCTACGETTCLDQSRSLAVRLPGGFRSEKVDVLVTGRCRACASDRSRP